MESAVRVYSWLGFFVEKVDANDIKSRPDARRLGPFAASDQQELVTWVRPTWQGNQKKRRAHFRRLPNRQIGDSHLDNLKREVEAEAKTKSTSILHNRSRDVLAEILRAHIGKPIHWSFKDTELSDFPVQGNLMRSVEVVETEYKFRTPFNQDYQFDIALLGPKISSRRILLGVIELELTHDFEYAKCLLCKCLGFPLISIDLKDDHASNLSGDDLLKRLVETTTSSADKRRRNFFYLHPSLYPVFLDIPQTILADHRHQYIIFASTEKLNSIWRWLDKLRACLSFSESDIHIDKPRVSNEQMRKQIENEGSIAGHDWQAYNHDEYIRVTLDRPTAKNDSNYFFHLVMAQIVNATYPALVGYKYERGLKNYETENPIWVRNAKSEGKWLDYRIAPKHLSDPIESILKAISRIGQRES